MKKMRLAIAMIELIIAIVVISIVLLAVPNVLGQISRNAYTIHDSSLIDNLYSKMSQEIDTHATGSISASPRDGNFGRKHITYNPYKSMSGAEVRTIEMGSPNSEKNGEIILRGFGMSTIPRRIKRESHE